MNIKLFAYKSILYHDQAKQTNIFIISFVEWHSTLCVLCVCVCVFVRYIFHSAFFFLAFPLCECSYVCLCFCDMPFRLSFYFFFHHFRSCARIKNTKKITSHSLAECNSRKNKWNTSESEKKLVKNMFNAHLLFCLIRLFRWCMCAVVFSPFRSFHFDYFFVLSHSVWK